MSLVPSCSDHLEADFMQDLTITTLICEAITVYWMGLVSSCSGHLEADFMPDLKIVTLKI